jgi:hypothetical protein
VKKRRAEWDFPYEPSSGGGPTEKGDALDVLVATSRAVEASAVRAALTGLGPNHEVEILIDRAPLHWIRIRAAAPASRLDVAGALSRSQAPVRYVVAARSCTMAMPPPLDLSSAAPARPVTWRVRRASRAATASTASGLWFLGDRDGGVRVDRAVCGTGAGTRLAVIDDDVADFEHLDLERVERVGVERVPAANGHAALMVGWSAGATRPNGTRFIGIAPDSSVRVYCTPKAGVDVVHTPLAIARAVFDGADVIVCATYVEGTTSPMLDDALQVAARLGRRGRGTVVIMPTGRETSSPRGTVHASLSLALGDPASDPRVHCIAPGGRHGGWFLWRSPQGKLRPFSNRGPAVRWLAPGDDLAYPFSSRDRLFHAESSGASAVAAGVASLLLACNPKLRLSEVHAILARSVDEPDRDMSQQAVLADPADVLPLGRDRDGHDAKCGYGRLNARRACAIARDPFALELVAMGEEELATTWCVRPARPYSARLARWAVRALLARPDLEHSVRVVLRHARLVATEPSRARAHAPGALARQLCVTVRELASSVRPRRLVREELERTLDALQRASNPSGSFGEVFERAALTLFQELYREKRSGPRGCSFSEAGLRS